MKNLRGTLFGIFSLWLCSLGVWIVILFNVDPTKSDILSYITFVASLFLWLSSLHTLIEYFIRIRANKGEMIYAPLPIATRHGVMVALAVSLLIALQFVHILNFLDAILIIIIIAISELYFKGRPQNAKPANHQN